MTTSIVKETPPTVIPITSPTDKVALLATVLCELIPVLEELNPLFIDVEAFPRLVVNVNSFSV